MGNVGAVYNRSCQIVYTELDQFGRLWRHVNANPLAAKRVCGTASGRTTAERAEDHVVLVGAVFNDPLQKSKGFWFGYTNLALADGTMG